MTELHASGSADRIPARWTILGVANWGESASVPECKKKKLGDIKKANVRKPKGSN